MAMATTVAGGARILSPFSTVSRSSIAASSSSRVAHLCSSFKGLSIQKWQKSSSGHAGDITDFSGIASSSSVSNGTTTTRKLVFTFAKIKTHKAAAKQFKVTGSGKIMRRQARKQHLLSKKNSNRKRRLSKMVEDGGCSLPCENQLECGHACPRRCHPGSHDLVVCPKPCLKQCDACLHKCKHRCHGLEDCPPCDVRVTKEMPGCGHQQTMQCSTDVEDEDCSTICPKSLRV